jgi:putative addiction module killer protein
MFEIHTTAEFDAWIESLDKRTRIRMVARLSKLSRGLWGDCKPVGDGVTELREHFGAGYRIYVTQIGAIVIVALGGGDKSTQSADIKRAVEMARIAKE